MFFCEDKNEFQTNIKDFQHYLILKIIIVFRHFEQIFFCEMAYNKSIAILRHEKVDGFLSVNSVFLLMSKSVTNRTSDTKDQIRTFPE